MLIKLYIFNFGIINKAQLDLVGGLTIITGETGAGKSLLMNALGLISGKRADTSAILNKEKKSVIEAHFTQIPKNLLKRYDTDDQYPTILRREIYPGGKSRSFINDNPVSLEQFGKLGRKLIDIHGQYDHQLINDTHYQLKFLDNYCENEKFLEKYQSYFEKYRRIKERLRLLEERQTNHLRNQEYDNFLLQELHTANIIDNEEKELEREAYQLTHAQEIRTWLSEGVSLLEHEEGGLLSQLTRLKNCLEKSAELSHSHHEFTERAHAAWIEMNDLQNEMIHWIDNVESQPQYLEAIHQRLDLLSRLQKKHQVTSSGELLKVQEKLEKQRQETENIHLNLRDLKGEERILWNELKEQCTKLSDRRKEKIPQLEQAITTLLHKLEMPEAKVKIQLIPARDLHTMGAENIQILFSANKGSSLQELSKTASGGERSRLMLAMKSLVNTQEHFPTLILDEIDTGVSGKIADKVGDLLQNMACRGQLIAITHLPQVAAKGQKHLRVYKTEKDARTITVFKELTKTEQVEEIAQMLSGTAVTEAARLQAQMLLSSGKAESKN